MISQLFSGQSQSDSNQNDGGRRHRRMRAEEGPGGGNTGITKYNISFFYMNRLITLQDKIADLGIGIDGSGSILVLKGGVDPPKIFHRLK